MKKRHALAGRKQSPKHIENRIAGYRGHPLSASHKRKISRGKRRTWKNASLKYRRVVLDALDRGRRSEKKKDANRLWWQKLKADPKCWANYQKKMRVRPQLWKKGKAWSKESRRKMSIAQTGQPQSLEERRKRSQSIRAVIKKRGKGFTAGRKISPEHVEALRLANLGRKFSPESIAKRSGPNHHNYGKPAQKGAGIGHGSYCKKGHWVRSTWERHVADWLFDSGIEYGYESKLFDLGDGLRYRPDFWLSMQDVYIEVKGYLTPWDREKHARFRKMGNRLLLVEDLDSRTMTKLRLKLQVETTVGSR